VSGPEIRRIRGRADRRGGWTPAATDRAFPAIRFNAVDPGYTATDLNGLQGTRTVEEGAEIIVRMASIGADGPTGEALAV
jgi:NAD(P)-dependent dehydrogenase (short-subunit alcohol dehydrogenase family)